MSPSFGISQFWFECPPIAAPVDKFRAAILSSGGYDLHAHSQQFLLFPLRHFFRLHRRATKQVNGEAECGIEQARSVNRSRLSRNSALKIPHRVRQRSRKVCGTSKEIQGVIVAEGRNVVSAGCIADRNRAVEVQASGVEAPGDRNRIGMHRRYYISARGQVLRGSPRGQRQKQN